MGTGIGLFYPGYTQLTTNLLLFSSVFEMKIIFEKSIVARSGMPLTYKSYIQFHCLIKLNKYTIKPININSFQLDFIIFVLNQQFLWTFITQSDIRKCSLSFKTMAIVFTHILIDRLISFWAEPEKHSQIFNQIPEMVNSNITICND